MKKGDDEEKRKKGSTAGHVKEYNSELERRTGAAVRRADARRK